MVITIDSIMIDKKAVIRIIGKCQNPSGLTQGICRDIDPLQVAAYESSLIRAAKVERKTPPQTKVLGH